MDATLGLLEQALRISVPFALAAAGGALSERAGVINLALEGLILVGAFAAAVTSTVAGGGVAVAAAIAAGVALAAVHALVTVRFRANAIVSGVAINLLAAGGTRFLLAAWFGTTANSPRIEGWQPGTPALVVGTLLLGGLCHVAMFRTAFGLRLRAAGEHPEAARALGVSVARTRVMGVLLSGVLAALAGAWLAFDQHQFSDGMSAGRGYIAVAAMILGRWTPLGAMAAGLLFGTAEAAQIGLQTAGWGLPGPLVQTFPYVLTMLALTGLIGRSRPPLALGTPPPED